MADEPDELDEVDPESELGLYRRERLDALARELFGNNRAECGRALGYQDGSYVGQMIRGKRTITEKTIRKAEKLPKAHGWFDPPGGRPSRNLASEDFEIVDRGDKVPLLSSVPGGDWCEAHEPFRPDEIEEWLSCPTKHGPDTFALRLKGISMEGPGGYREGEIVFIDPGAEARAGKDVVARTPDGKVTFKRLGEDDEGFYLYALNPAWPDRIIRAPKGTIFCGVAISSLIQR